MAVAFKRRGVEVKPRESAENMAKSGKSFASSFVQAKGSLT
jgi:hypothetical protein